MDPNYDDDDDRDHPLQEPEFVIHVVDDDRCRRALAPPPPVLPVQYHPPLPPQHEPDDDQRNVPRIKRLKDFMLFPQGILTSWSMLVGCIVIFYVARPDMHPHLDLIRAMVGLIMLCLLLSMLLSCVGVYVYDRYPSLNDWLHS